MLVVNLKFCGGNFFKHLSTCKSTYRTSPKSISTTVFNSLSHFTTLTSRQKDQIHLYVDTLLQWNKRLNLTAVKEVDEVMERHVEDSLAILPPLRDCFRSHCGTSNDKLKLVDVGTGAGLPGIILAIACPEWDVTLLESMNKRCVFLEHAVGVTGLSNIQIVRGRAEEKKLRKGGASMCYVVIFGMLIKMRHFAIDDILKTVNMTLPKAGWNT